MGQLLTSFSPFMQDLIISGKLLEDLKLSPDELLMELALYLYSTDKLSMGQAKRLAGLAQLEFQEKMAERDIEIKYDLEEFEKDLKNLDDLS